jgi:hypothetical protein
MILSEPLYPDLNDPEYIKRRDFLLKRMKKERWELNLPESKPSKPKGRKPSPSKRVVEPDPNKRINKFFKFGNDTD